MTRAIGFALITCCGILGTWIPGVFAEQGRDLEEPISEAYTWQNIAIVGGGFVPGFVFHPKQPGLAYCRTDIGGAYRWDDGQQRWIPLQDWVNRDDWTLMGIESIGLDPHDPERVYLAAGTYTNDWSGNGAILRSTDQGKTWQRTNVPFKFGGNENGRSMGERLVVNSRHSNQLFLGTRRNGLWKSEDYGATWEPVERFPSTANTNNIGIGFILFDERSGNADEATPAIYAGMADPKVPLWRSTDRGVTWHEVAGQPKGLIPHHAALASNGTLYLTYSNGPGPNDITDGTVWKLNTRTGDWTEISPVKPASRERDNQGARFGYAGLSVAADNPDTLVVSTIDRWWPGDDIFHSVDGGKNWTGLRANAIRDSSRSPFVSWGKEEIEFGHWIGDVRIDPHNSNRAFYGTGSTIWRTEDLSAAADGKPTHWKIGALGVEETAVIDLISPPEGAHLISGLGDIGGFRHDDFTVSPPIWTNPMMSNTESLDFAENKPEIVVRVGRGRDQQGAYSMDGAKSWSPFSGEPSKPSGAGSVAVTADGSIFLWAPANAPTFVTRDHGTSWINSKGAPNGLQIVTDRVDPVSVYGICGNDRTVYVSEDSGTTFKAAAKGLPAGRLRLKATPGRKGDLWMTADASGLYHSINGGKTFEKLSTIAEVAALGFGKAKPGSNSVALYAIGRVATGGIGGVFRSDDLGKRWIQITDDQHRYGGIGQAITGDPRIYGRVYLGTNGRGVLYADPATR